MARNYKVLIKTFVEWQARMSIQLPTTVMVQLAPFCVHLKKL